MAPHYDRHVDSSAEQNDFNIASVARVDDAAMDDAAEALREVEIEAAQPEPDIPDVSALNPARIAAMNIDELRAVAKELDVPDRATITETDELIAAICQRL